MNNLNKIFNVNDCLEEFFYSDMTYILTREEQMAQWNDFICNTEKE